MLEMVSGSNFRCYERVKLEFGSHRVSVVFGDSQSDYADSNGTGKTSLMYLVLWTLFGKWPGMGNADSCVRQPANKDCSGIVWITRPDGRYAISRWRRDTIHGNNVFIQPPNHTGAATTGPDIISGDLKVMNERIEGLLGLNYETFVRTLVFTGAESTTFALMTDKEQKTLLDTIVPLDFSRLLETSRTKEKFAGETEIECNGVTKAVENWIERNEAQIKELDERRVKLGQGNAGLEIQKRIDELDATIVDHEGSINIAEASRRELRPQLDAAVVAIGEYKPTEQSYHDSAQRFSSYQSAMTTLTRQEQERKTSLDQADRAVQAAADRLSQDVETKTCHTCGQSLNDVSMQQAQASVQQELNNAKELKLQTVEHHDKLQEHYQRLRDESGFNEATASEYLRNSQAAYTHMDKLEMALLVLTGQDREFDEAIVRRRQYIKNCGTDKIELQSTLTSSTTGLTKIEEDMDRLKQEIIRLKGDLKASGENQTQWRVEKELWNNVSGMFSGGKGSLQHFIFESMLPELTATAQMFLSLFSKTELRVAFKSHRKKGTKTVEGFYIEATKGEQTGSYGDLSGGERRRLDFCIFLTLWLLTAKHVFSPKVLFLDEIADFMDDTGQQAVIGVLDFFCQQYGVSCLLLTNKRELVASVAHGYRCSMADGISTLVSVQET